MTYYGAPFQSTDDGFQSSTTGQWESSSLNQYIPTAQLWTTDLTGTSAGMPYPPTHYGQSVAYVNPQQQFPVYSSGYANPRNIPHTHSAPQYPQYQSPTHPSAYPSTPYGGGWSAAHPAGAIIPPPRSHSHRNPQYPNPRPPINAQSPQHVPPHAQIILPEASSEDESRSINKRCSHCRAMSTPAWRRDPRTHKTLCNACGVYLSQHQQLRPQKLIDVDNEVPVYDPGNADLHGPHCSNCGTRKTSTWRRNKAGDQVCNACGVYERSNGRPRPSTLRSDKIRPRDKH
ncbi:hypothetical protein DFH06DRAFT_1190413 [Mycena polygramma]|nr:hypothetical protein DFH06DRAFT_1190413 [Mycena polygramma]